MTDAGATALTERDAAAAADLRERFGFLREVVAEMERSVPYAAALMQLLKEQAFVKMVN